MNSIRRFARYLEPLIRGYLWYAPTERGKWRLWSWASRHGLLRCDLKRIVTTRHGFLMELNTAELIDRFIYYFGCWEPDETRTIQKLLRKGDTFVDVGANVGYYTLLASNIVGPTGLVYSFEPSPVMFDRLQRHVSLNRCVNVQCVSKACGSSAGTAVLSCLSQRNPGTQTLRKVDFAAYQWVVDVVRLDEWLDQQKAAHYRLIKIDVEGFELSVLRGMRKLLERNKVDYILCELTESWLKNEGAGIRDVLEFLGAFNFSPFLIRDTALEKLRSMPLEDQNNFLFVRDERSITNEN